MIKNIVIVVFLVLVGSQAVAGGEFKYRSFPLGVEENAGVAVSCTENNRCTVCGVDWSAVNVPHSVNCTTFTRAPE